MRRFLNTIYLAALALTLSSCSSTVTEAIFEPTEAQEKAEVKKLAQQILRHKNIDLMRKQVSGRRDGASSWDNIYGASRGYAAKRSSYGRAPGGYVRLKASMLRGMLRYAEAGYRFRVTSIAGGSHSRRSRHYAGVAFDVDKINGVRVRHRGCPHWRFRKTARRYGATEIKGPGNRGHTGHVHVAWPRE